MSSFILLTYHKFWRQCELSLSPIWKSLCTHHSVLVNNVECRCHSSYKRKKSIRNQLQKFSPHSSRHNLSCRPFVFVILSLIWLCCAILSVTKLPKSAGFLFSICSSVCSWTCFNMSIMLADIDATCASLGYYDGQKYIPETHVLQGLKVNFTNNSTRSFSINSLRL